MRVDDTIMADDDEPRDILRQVDLGEYRTGLVLTVWDTHRTDRMGKCILGYELRTPSGVLFCAEDFGCSPMHSVDSDECIAALLSFLVLRPGDTDAEYFESYTAEQLEWARSSAYDQLACDLAESEDMGDYGYVLWRGCPAPGDVYAHLYDLRAQAATWAADGQVDDECREDGYDAEPRLTVDVRLQVYDGGWVVSSGDAQYDTDHPGHWGASSVSSDMTDDDLEQVAGDLVEQVRYSMSVEEGI